MSETTSNKVQPAKKANAKKTANGADSKLFVSPVVSAIFLDYFYCFSSCSYLR